MTQPAERITTDPTKNKKIIFVIAEVEMSGTVFSAKKIPNKQGKNNSQIPIGWLSLTSLR
jgi:hypothetical protein